MCSEALGLELCKSCGTLPDEEGNVNALSAGLGSAHPSLC